MRADQERFLLETGYRHVRDKDIPEVEAWLEANDGSEDSMIFELMGSRLAEYKEMVEAFEQKGTTC